MLNSKVRVKADCPPAEKHQIESLERFHPTLTLKKPFYDGKRDILINGIPTSLKNIGYREDGIEYGAPSIISNQEENIKDHLLQDDENLVKWYNYFTSNKGKILADILPYEQGQTIFKYLLFKGGLNGDHLNKAQAVLMSGDFKVRHSEQIIHFGFFIKSTDTENLVKLYKCIKIDTKKELGLRINKSLLKTMFHYNPQRMSSSDNRIIGL
jgi:hypothetical protein